MTSSTPYPAAQYATQVNAARTSADVAPAMVMSGGDWHINEQRPDYWCARFAEHGYACCDVLRRETLKMFPRAVRNRGAQARAAHGR